ncbi:MAG: zinc-binding alcohol dehydrogenase family protein [Bacteroidota bacterium]
MKQLVICSKDLHLHYDRVLDYGEMQLYNQPIHFALIEYQAPHFQPQKSPKGVLVKKKAFSCNYRDRSIMNTLRERINQSKNLTFFPIGSEFAGEVVKVGTEVNHLKIGDRVIADAFYQFPPISMAPPGLPTNSASREYEVFHEEKLAKIPENMSASVAAAFTIGAQTVYSMIDRLQLKPGARVLVTGVKSKTSLFAIQALKNKGVDICGVSRSQVDVAYFKRLGLSHVFCIGDKNIGELPETLTYLKDHGPFDAVIDPFSDFYLLKVLDAMAFGSRYITCGLSNQTEEKFTLVDLTQTFGKILLLNISIIGNCLGTTQHLQQALDDYSQRKFEVTIGSEIENDITAFMEKSFLDHEHRGKVIYKYSDY